jgi:hypothetical protein
MSIVDLSYHTYISIQVFVYLILTDKSIVDLLLYNMYLFYKAIDLSLIN